MRFVLSSLVFVLVGLASSTQAELKPEEVAVVANRNSEESRKLAAYYLRVRNIPKEHVIQLDVPEEETVSREVYEKNVRSYVQSWLQQKDPDGKIRCFVTFRGLPLKIEKSVNDPLAKELESYLTKERSERIGRLNESLSLLSKLANGTETPQMISATAPADEIRGAFESIFPATQKRVMALEEAARNQSNADFQNLFVRVAGLNAFAQSLGAQLQSMSAVNPNVRTQFDVMRGQSAGLQEGRLLVESLPLGIDRDRQAIGAVERSDGIIGTIIWIDNELEVLRMNETHASFDSELGLSAMPDYALLRWQPNYLHHSFDNSAIHDFRRTIMVSRIDAPSLELCRTMMDTSIQVEKSGLKGKVYLDGRGLADGTGPSARTLDADYDRSIVSAEQILKAHTKMEIVLDTRPELFKEGDCPDAALYCGWYSLAKYVDAFSWNPGAIGFHVASEEAKTLHDPSSQVWCKRMIEDGVAGTLGPVYEPYTQAFPRADQFLVLLVSGRHSLAECYYRTTLYSSWTLTLVGDPLYKPFASNPQLDMATLPSAYKYLVTGEY